MKIVTVEPGSPQWLEWRRQGVGSSDIPAIMGVCPYKTAKDIYDDKMGKVSKKRNSAMQRGVDYEDEARTVFMRMRENEGGEGKYVPLNIEHDDNPMFKASLDGYNSFNRCIVEIKIPSRKVLDQASFGQVPANYLLQIQWQLYVSGSPKAYYFCYNPESLEAYGVDVYPDSDMIDKILEKVNGFIADWQAGIPPKSQKDTKVLGESMERIVERMASIKDEIKILEAQYKTLLDSVLDEVGTEQSLECSDFILTRSERSSIDYKRAAEEANVNLETYRKPSTVSWTIRKKGNGIYEEAS